MKSLYVPFCGFGSNFWRDVQKVAKIWCHLLVRRLYMRRERCHALYFRSLLLTPNRKAMHPIVATKMIVIMSDFDVKKSVLQASKRHQAQASKSR